MPRPASKSAFTLLEALMAGALTGLLIALAVAVFVPLARATRRYYRRSDQQQRTEAALDRMRRLVEGSKATAIRVYEQPGKVLQTQAIDRVGPEARTLWANEVEFVSLSAAEELRLTKVSGPNFWQRPYFPTPQQLVQHLQAPSSLLCPQVKRFEIEGYSERGIHLPLLIRVVTESPLQGQEPAYRYLLEARVRPLIRHAL